MSVISEKFNPADIDPVIPTEVMTQIARLILAWARLDALISQDLFAWVKVPFDVGTILVRRMGLTDKQARITELQAHFTGEPAHEDAAAIAKLQNEWYQIRNTVCHSQCLGVSRGDHPGCLAFFHSNFIKGLPGKQRIRYLTYGTVSSAADFAETSASFRIEQSNLISAIQEKWMQRERASHV